MARSATKSPLTAEERRLLDAFLAQDFPGASELRAQAGTVVASRGCDCGCGTINLHPEGDRGLPRVSVTSPLPLQGTVKDESGELVGGLLLFVEEGLLASLEVYSFGPEPLPLPPVERVEWYTVGA